MKTIIMFTGDTCGKCGAAKMHLENLPAHIKEGLELIEVNIDKVAGAKEILQGKYNSSTLPTFIIEGYDPLLGFDGNFGKIQEYLGL